MITSTVDDILKIINNFDDTDIEKTYYLDVLKTMTKVDNKIIKPNQIIIVSQLFNR